MLQGMKTQKSLQYRFKTLQLLDIAQLKLQILLYGADIVKETFAPTIQIFHTKLIEHYQQRLQKLQNLSKNPSHATKTFIDGKAQGYFDVLMKVRQMTTGLLDDSFISQQKLKDTTKIHSPWDIFSQLVINYESMLLKRTNLTAKQILMKHVIET